MGKREVSGPLKTILEADVALTNQFCTLIEKFMSFRSLKAHYKMLELSCHGIPWLGGWLLFIWFANNSSLYQMQVNFYLGIILDLIIVAVIKSITRRRRPSLNTPDMPVTMGPDKFSFPSGHATRAVFVATFFIYLYPLPLPVQLPLVAWSSAVCISRVLLRRHHLLDVTAGVIVGCLETLLIALLWLEQDASAYLIAYLSDDSPSLTV